MLEAIEPLVRRAIVPILFVLVMLGMRCESAASECRPPERMEAHPQALDEAMYRLMLVPSSVAHGKPYAWKHCREAPGGCDARIRAFGEYIRNVSDFYGVDPWLVAAMAVKESGLNPWAQGKGDELGILQIHPRRREASKIALFDQRERKRCHNRVGECQLEIVFTAIGILRRSFAICGNAVDALGMYNRGVCGPSGYALRVLQIRRELLASVGVTNSEA